MMRIVMAIALDIFEALRSAGVEDAKAKSAAEKLDGALEARFQRELKALATREDLANVRTEMANVRTEISNVRAELLAEMGRLETRVIRWNVGTIIAVAGVTLAIVRLLG